MRVMVVFTVKSSKKVIRLFNTPFITNFIIFMILKIEEILKILNNFVKFSILIGSVFFNIVESEVDIKKSIKSKGIPLRKSGKNVWER